MINQKMNPEVKARWIEALNSGLYPQGKWWLSNEGKFCCLGVLCDLAEKAGVAKVAPSSDTPVVYEDHDGRRNHSELPAGVADWAGLPRGVLLSDPQGYLVTLNDRGVPFKQIAKAIEEHL